MVKLYTKLAFAITTRTEGAKKCGEAHLKRQYELREFHEFKHSSQSLGRFLKCPTGDA